MSENKNMLDNEIKDMDMSEFVDNYLKEEEERRWKDEDRFNNFLEYLIDYIAKNKRVLSDDFYYDEDGCKPYTFREFESYLNSLYDIVHNYAKKNFIDNCFLLTDEDMFSEYSYCVKIKDKFYHIELVSGQGSFILFESAESKKNIDSYVDYDLMMSNDKSPSYEHNLQLRINAEIEGLIDSLVQEGVDRTIIEKIIKEYKF